MPAATERVIGSHGSSAHHDKDFHTVAGFLADVVGDYASISSAMATVFFLPYHLVDSGYRNGSYASRDSRFE